MDSIVTKIRQHRHNAYRQQENVTLCMMGPEEYMRFREEIGFGAFNLIPGHNTYNGYRIVVTRRPGLAFQ